MGKWKTKTLEEAHSHSSNHRKEILESFICVCFCCFKYCQPSKIIMGIDNNKTAVCPHCGVDALIGSAAGIKITKTFLERMNECWFSDD